MAGNALQKEASTYSTPNKIGNMKLLLEYGANPNVQDIDEKTYARARGKTPQQLIMLEKWNFFDDVRYPHSHEAFLITKSNKAIQAHREEVLK